MTGRVSFWLYFKVNIKIDLPEGTQGSPYSPILYVLFFNFKSESAEKEYYFADDVHFFMVGMNWKEVEDAILKLEIEFKSWCNRNGQKVNEKKTTVCFMFRRAALVGNSFDLKSYLVDDFRCLGVQIDSNMKFTSHCNYLAKWAKVRISILKILKFKLGISTDVLLRVAQSYRAKFMFGTWHLSLISESQFSTLARNWGLIVKYCCGFTKLVNTDLALNFAGLDDLDTYYKYWITTRSFDDKILNGRKDVIGQYFDRKKSMEGNLPELGYSLRSSTVERRRSANLEKVAKWPVRAAKWFDDCREWRDICMTLFDKHMMGYKGVLKKKVLRKLIAKGTPIEDEVKKINDEAFKNSGIIV